MAVKNKHDVGQVVEAYCGKCKMSTGHIITAKMGEQIKRVICSTCNAQHNYRVLKNSAPSSAGPKARAPRKSPSKKASTRQSVEQQWEKRIQSLEVKEAVPYNMKGNFEENSLLEHTKYGLGVVTKKSTNSRIEVLFRDMPRMLAINRN